MADPKPIEQYKCDVCGQPATHAARDIACVSGPLDTIERYEMLDPVKFGCDRHPVESIEYDYRTLY